MLSKILRRTHMYAALFLMPWILMYGISTVTMNHHYSRDRFPVTREREQTFAGQFSPNATPQMKAETILRELNMEGAYNVNANKDRIVINRRDAVTPRRITYTPADGKLSIDKLSINTIGVLEGLHHRRGYNNRFTADITWAFFVDATIAVIVFWALSGLWMWWEMKVTRRIGALCIGGSVVLFAIMVTIL